MATRGGGELLVCSEFQERQAADLVKEFKFSQPVRVTAVEVENRGSRDAQIRLYARPLTDPSAARFAALVPGPNTQTVPTGQSKRIPTPQAPLTDHVVLRMLFTVVRVTIYGNPLTPQSEAPPPAAAAPLPELNPLALPPHADCFAPPSVLRCPLGGLPLPALPPALLAALWLGLDYYSHVGHRLAKVARCPPEGRLQPLVAAGDAVARALRGDPTALAALQSLPEVQRALPGAAGGPSEPWSAWEWRALRMAVTWTHMLASGAAKQPADIEVGMGGLAAALVLCSTAQGAARFLAFHDAGAREINPTGISALMAIAAVAALPGVSSRMACSLAALLELLSLACGAQGCAALLGTYTPLAQALNPVGGGGGGAAAGFPAAAASAKLHATLTMDGSEGDGDEGAEMLAELVSADEEGVDVQAAEAGSPSGGGAEEDANDGSVDGGEPAAGRAEPATSRSCEDTGSGGSSGEARAVSEGLEGAGTDGAAAAASAAAASAPAPSAAAAAASGADAGARRVANGGGAGPAASSPLPERVDGTPSEDDGYGSALLSYGDSDWGDDEDGVRDDNAQSKPPAPARQLSGARRLLDAQPSGGATAAAAAAAAEAEGEAPAAVDQASADKGAAAPVALGEAGASMEGPGADQADAHADALARDVQGTHAGRPANGGDAPGRRRRGGGKRRRRRNEGTGRHGVYTWLASQLMRAGPSQLLTSCTSTLRRLHAQHVATHLQQLLSPVVERGSGASDLTAVAREATHVLLDLAGLCTQPRLPGSILEAPPGAWGSAGAEAAPARDASTGEGGGGRGDEGLGAGFSAAHSRSPWLGTPPSGAAATGAASRPSTAEASGRDAAAGGSAAAEAAVVVSAPALRGDVVVLQLLLALRVLELLPPLLSAFAEQVSAANPAAAAQLLPLYRSLHTATRTLLAAVLSTPEGLMLARTCPGHLAAIVACVTQPTERPAGGRPHATGDALSAALVAACAVGALEQPPLHADVLPAMLALTRGVAGLASRRAAVFALASSPAALLGLVRLAALCGGDNPADVEPWLGVVDGLDASSVGRGFQPASLYAPALLLEVLRDPDPQILQAWLPGTRAILGALQPTRQQLEEQQLAAGGPTSPGGAARLRALHVATGVLEAAAELQGGDCEQLVKWLDAQLPPLAAADTVGEERPVTAVGELAPPPPPPSELQEEAVAKLLRTPAALGRVLGALHLLTALLRRSADLGRLLGSEVAASTTPAHVPRLPGSSWAPQQALVNPEGLSVLGRALLLGAAAVRAAASATAWAFLGGEPVDAARRAAAARTAAEMLRAAAAAAAELLTAVRATHVHSAPLLTGVLAAHAAAAVSWEGLAAACGGGAAAAATAASASAQQQQQQQGGGEVHPLVAARHLLAQALAAWVRKEWSPPAVAWVLGARPLRSRVTPAADAALMDHRKATGRPPPPSPLPLSPDAVYPALLALGDLLPDEWPPRAPPGGAGAQRGDPPRVPPPTHMQLRRLVSDAIQEAATDQLRALVATAVGCDARLVRAALVRLCCKAVGLGGGMGPFLATPLLEELHAVTTTQAAASAGGGNAGGASAGLVSGGRRVLEVLTPLAFQPAMKAALLSRRAVLSLSRLMHSLASQQLPDPDTTPVMAMVVDALALLCNPDISLDPSIPREQRQAQDFPALTEAATLVAALLSSLAHLGACTPAACQLLLSPQYGLATHPRGRAAVRSGVARWHAHALQRGGAGAPAASASPAEAMRWGAATLRAAGQQLQGAEAQQACAALAALVEQLAASPDAEAEQQAAQVPPQPAQARFMALVQKALVALPAASPDDDDGVADVAGQTPQQLACDAAMQSFWQYVRQRPPRVKRKPQLIDVPAAVPASRMFGAPLEGEPNGSGRPRGRGAKERDHGGGRGRSRSPLGEREGGPPAKKAKLSEIGSSAAPNRAPSIPAVTARRHRTAGQFSDQTHRPASRHVDEVMAGARPRSGPAPLGMGPPPTGGLPPLAAAAAAAAAGLMPPAPVLVGHVPMMGLVPPPIMPPMIAGVPTPRAAATMAAPPTGLPVGLPGAHLPPSMQPPQMMAPRGGGLVEAADGRARPGPQFGGAQALPAQQQQQQQPKVSKSRQRRMARRQQKLRAAAAAGGGGPADSGGGGSDLLEGLMDDGDGDDAASGGVS